MSEQSVRCRKFTPPPSPEGSPATRPDIGTPPESIAIHQRSRVHANIHRLPESTQFSSSGATTAAGHHPISRRDIVASLHTGADTAKTMLSDDVAEARMKIRAMSYTSHCQDPHSLLRMYDKDRSGELGWDEFRAAVRKGGKMIEDGPRGITDVKLRR